MHRNGNRATALVVSLAVLMLLSMLGVSFVRISSLEQRASGNYQDILEARWLAQAGIDYATAELIREFQGNPLYMGWLYQRPDADASADPEYKSNLYAEDGVATGVSIEEIQQILTAGTRPSFGKIIRGMNVSGDVHDQHHIFTLRVFDVTSQININSQTTFLGQMLDNLSRAVARRKPYIDKVGDDGVGPLKGLGAQIVSQRPTGGYYSKWDLVGISDGKNTLDEQDLAYLLDYISVHPRVAKMQANSTYQQVKFLVPGDEKTYTTELRSPININTASWPVLVAVFQGVQIYEQKSEDEKSDWLGKWNEEKSKKESEWQEKDTPEKDQQKWLDKHNEDKDKWLEKWYDDQDKNRVTEQEAIILANRVCIRRTDIPFADLDDFYSFLDEEKKKIFSKEADRKLAALKANFTSVAFLRRLNPDIAVYKSIDKWDMVYYTTEFCFYPFGGFEIVSLGQVFDVGGQLRAFSKYYCVLNTFEVVTHTSQRDFETNSRYSSVADRVGNLHGFSHGNNLQKNGVDYDSLASNFFGLVQPIWYSALTGAAGLDSPKETGYGGSEPLGQGGNYTFRADFNGTVNANKGPHPQAGGSKAEVVGSGGLALPNSGTTFADLASDGVIFRADDTTPNTLYYLSRPNENPADDDPAAVGNFPPLVAAPGNTVPLDGSTNDGTLMFWFKLSSEWDSSDWRTVFFANTAFELADEINGGKFVMGVQKEVQMRVQTPLVTKEPWLRKLDVQVRSKFFCQKNGVSVTPPAPFMPYKYVDYGKSITLDPNDKQGVNAQEWYHLAVRWQDGNTLGEFAGANKDCAIAVTGTFYDKDSKVQAPKVVTKNEKGFAVGFNVVTEVAYNESLLPGEFDPLAPALKDKNRFYLGCAGRTASPQTTLDDLHITSDTTWAEDPAFMPSRYPLPATPTTSQISAVFQGSFPDQAQTPLFVRTMVLYPTTKEQQGGLIPPSWTQVGNKALPKDTWKELWVTMTGQKTPTLNLNNLEKKVENITVKVTKQDKIFQKEAVVVVKDSYGTLDNLANSSTSVDEPKEEKQEYEWQKQPDGKTTLADALIEWYCFRNNGEDPPELNNQGRDEMLVTSQIDPDNPKHYNIVFYNGKNNTPIYASPVVVQVVLGYLQKSSFSEYREFLH